MTTPNAPTNSSRNGGTGWGGGVIAVVVIIAIVKYANGPSKPSPLPLQNAPRTPITDIAKAPPQNLPSTPEKSTTHNPRPPVNDPWEAIIGDGKAPGTKRPPPNDPWEAVIGGTPTGSPTTPMRNPLEQLGWNRAECMLCKARRTKQDQALFSDGNGFGFCDKCGTCANAFAVYRDDFQRGIRTTPQVEQQGKLYAKSVESLANQNPLFGPTYQIFFQWGNEKSWQESWRNLATLTAGPNPGR